MIDSGIIIKINNMVVYSANDCSPCDKAIKYIKDNYKLHVKSYIKTGDKLDVLIKTLNGKRQKIKKMVFLKLMVV
mgnify:CR=1 FL=1